jgi:integrase
LSSPARTGRRSGRGPSRVSSITTSATSGCRRSGYTTSGTPTPTLALEAGVHPKVVQERLGHATIAITLDVYSHAIPALQEDAAETIAALLGR